MKAEYVNPAVLRFLMGYMQHDNALALEVSLQTGLRIDDVLSAPASSLNGRTLKITEKKTGKEATKSVDGATAKRLRSNASETVLFPSRKRGKRKTPHKTRQAVFADLKKAAARAGLVTHVSPHSARKSYAVGVFHDGGLSAVKEALNHDRELTSMIYAFSDRLSEHHDELTQHKDENAQKCADIEQMFAKFELKLAEIGQKVDFLITLLKKSTCTT